MGESELYRLLEQYKNGDLSEEEIIRFFKRHSVENLEFANIDHDRAIRKGFPEVIYCEGKTHEQVRIIIESILKKSDKLLATRASEECFKHVQQYIQGLEYYPASRIITTKETLQEGETNEKTICVVCAGTSDIPVAEEAYLTATAMGMGVRKVYDVGIAGIHRLLSRLEELQKSKVIIVAAGMEGALASAVGGLVDIPVIAVPTSIGYGASFGGLAALLAMLNSCAPGVTVVNIDNGFGAGYAAVQIIKSINKD